ncbi:MAG: hypothetical protein A2Y17_03400 [Clostridiales bacterium GWF2_38_85]|nr:MAG: hypothetical protein A2Y17_03400 [Clostridiales bacterium GWF2_38_85]HBL85253.1 two-component sensor histidine kinase [Clostridiales bacterium]
MNRIAKRLFFNFLISLLVISLILSFIFLIVFRNHTYDIQKNQLQSKAITIADSISDFLENNSSMMGRSVNSGFRNYLRVLNNVAESDIWVVDQDMNLIKFGMMMNSVSYYEIPEDGKSLVQTAFDGETVMSEAFSSFLGERSVTVATPVFDLNNNTVAVVLMHTSISGVNAAVNESGKLLILSLSIAIILSLAISIYLSYRFVKPINDIKNTTVILSQGDYTVKTSVKQKDEIGDLAIAVDILSEKLKLSSEESHKLEKLRNDFITNISHELRTPVTVIRGSLETICDGVITEKADIDSFHKQMLNESIHLQRLVNDLLELSKLQSTDFAIEKSELNLYDVATDAVYGMRNISDKKKVTISFASNKNNITVEGDYSRLKQMLTIILDNAVKFSHENGMVNISLNAFTGYVEILIINNGIGIEKEELQNIFERFYKNNTEKNREGTGLGLAIAKQIAEKHNASISVDSIPGVKTEFKIIIPIK